MPKLNEIQFIQTTPSTFYRRSKRPYTLNNQDQQISDSDILEKLQLILISMRQQSAKVTRYFQQEMQNLQSQVNEQSNIITLLQEQNKLLRSHINIYESKFGGFSKIVGKSQQNQLSEIKIQTFQQSNDYQQNLLTKKEMNFLKFNDEKKQNNFSKMSTKYESNIQSSSLDKEKSKKSQQHDETSSKYTDELFSQNGSTCSNFYKKSLPFHHRRQSSLQEQQSKGLYENHEINILPLITRCQKPQKTQISQISELQNRKSTIIDIFKEEESENQSQEIYQEVNELGLESKGNGFFCDGQMWTSQNKQETLLIQNYEPYYQNNGIKLCRYVQSREDFDEQQDYSPLKEETQMKKISSISSDKQSDQKNQLPGQKNEIIEDIKPQNFTRQQLLNKGVQNSSNCKQQDIQPTKSIVKKYNQKEVQKSKICGQKRLRALFAPLPSNFMSKKINLPFMNKEQHCNDQQTKKSSEMFDILADFHKKKSFGCETQNPLQQAIKKLKKSQQMKVKH